MSEEEVYEKLYGDMQPYSVMDFMVYLRDQIKCFPMGAEGKSGIASNSQIIRMFRNNAIELNGNIVNNFKMQFQFPIDSLVFFPKGKMRTTVR